MRSKSELKKLVCEAIDKRKDDILNIGDSVFNDPELGYKEYKTAQKIKDVFDQLGIDYEDEIAITGIKGRVEGNNDKRTVAVIGEMDSVVSPNHPNANKETGAAHCCGHNAMVAALVGVAYALKDTDVMNDLDGNVALLAVPAEEFVELGFRKSLMKEGKVDFVGGKQQFIKEGAFDDVDITVMQHTYGSEVEGNEIVAIAGDSSNGFIGQEIKFIGLESHAGMAPHKGINALAAAQVALAAINAQRDTFQEKDYIRVHPIITKGGDLVNVVPGEVNVESYVRGSNVKAILDAGEKVTRSWKAGAYALGAEVEINTLPGYMPYETEEGLKNLTYKNMVELFGEEKVLKTGPHGAASSDIGDVSAIMPTVQFHMGGANDKFHNDAFKISNRDLAYLGAAKIMAMDVIDLIYDGAKEAEEIIANFTPTYTKEEYLKEWGAIGDRFN